MQAFYNSDIRAPLGLCTNIYSTMFIGWVLVATKAVCVNNQTPLREVVVGIQTRILIIIINAANKVGIFYRLHDAGRQSFC